MNIAIIGAGPAGLMCALQASEDKQNKITIFDGNAKVGKKLFITGKGRCNVCNNTDSDGVLKNVVNNSKFLYSALNTFTPQDTINFFENNGVPLKTERGNRVFPVSDKSSDIIKVFEKLIKKSNIELRLNSFVNEILLERNGGGFCVYCKGRKEIFDAIVLATGGKSYSSTGSTGAGYEFAKKFGHNIVGVKPALVPILLNNYDGSLAGLSLKNVEIKAKFDNKDYKMFGEMLFTHNGVSGPIVLSLSSYINKFDIKGHNLYIDLKPALNEKQLDNRLIRDFEMEKFKSLKNYMKELLPSSMVDFFIKKGKLNEDIKLHEINKEMRGQIISLLKNFSLELKSLDNLDFGIVTSGGVDTKEINPKTMESKICKNLFIVGELVDVDALTGGYNIQIALSTGFVAGNYLKELNL